MRDFLSILAKLALDNGFAALPSLFTILVTPSPNVVCKEADLVVVVKAPRGIYCTVVSHHSYIRFLPSHHDLPQDQLLLYYCY